MVLAKILSSYTFRFTVGSVVILSMIVMFVMVIVYGIFSYNYFHDVHKELSAELEKVADVYNRGGIAGIDEFIEQRGQRYDIVPFAYLLVDDNLHKLTGDLDSWPKFREYGDGWLSFELGILQRDGDSRDHEFVARSQQLPDGNQLLVARSYERVLAYIQFVAGILLRGFIVTVLMGTLGAFFITWALQRRLDTINRTIKTIMTGNLSERLDIIDSPSEIEQLAVNLNDMLDRIEYLMDGVKQVSDNIAHDLRTPLTRLRNRLAKFESECSDENVENVQLLIAEVDEMLVTFNALLRIARIELGEGSSEKTCIRLDVLVGDVVDLYEPLALDKNISIETELLPAELMGDKNLLFQAVANVVDNAIKYTPEGGRVFVNISLDSNGNLLKNEHRVRDEENEEIVLTVSDSGCGVAEDNRKKVFRRFYREESSRSLQSGNGLGLSLVAAVITLHKSIILLDDNFPGLRVRMVFPVYKPHNNEGVVNSIQSASSANVNREMSTSSSL